MATPEARPNQAFERHLAELARIAFEASVKVACEEPSSERLAKLARRMERLADKQIEQAETAALQKTACRAGCCFCCLQQVLASVPEILAVAAYVHEHW
ncbi:MAG: hypothetical protein QOJ65_1089, partial [Fimbriimonadaceae bacterium]|nr:hypothetical protein [Fimbriimonadaceae bacterium]